MCVSCYISEYFCVFCFLCTPPFEEDPVHTFMNEASELDASLIL